MRTARPALVAGTVLAVARALGEDRDARDGLRWRRLRAEPRRRSHLLRRAGQAAALDDPATSEELTSLPMRHTIFAIASVLLFSALMLSLAGWAAKQPMKRYGGAGVCDDRTRGAPPQPQPRRRSARDSSASWRLTDRIGLAIAWVLGVGFLVITVAIVAFRRDPGHPVCAVWSCW